MASSGQSVFESSVYEICTGWADEELEILCMFMGRVDVWADFETGHTGWACPDCKTEHVRSL